MKVIVDIYGKEWKRIGGSTNVNGVQDLDLYRQGSKPHNAETCAGWA
jgi:hypothetical protein